MLGRGDCLPLPQQGPAGRKPEAGQLGADSRLQAGAPATWGLKLPQAPRPQTARAGGGGGEEGHRGSVPPPWQERLTGARDKRRTCNRPHAPLSGPALAGPQGPGGNILSARLPACGLATSQGPVQGRGEAGGGDSRSPRDWVGAVGRSGLRAAERDRVPLCLPCCCVVQGRPSTPRVAGSWPSLLGCTGAGVDRGQGRVA